SSTATNTPTRTPTNTATRTSTRTSVSTNTNTATRTATYALTATLTRTNTPSNTPTRAATVAATPTVRAEGCTPGFWQGGVGSQLWNQVNDPDWTRRGGVGTNPFIQSTLFNSYFTPHSSL